jgi:hypothetical protein
VAGSRVSGSDIVVLLGAGSVVLPTNSASYGVSTGPGHVVELGD